MSFSRWEEIIPGEENTHRYKVKRGVRVGNWHAGRQEPEGELEEIIGKDGILRDTV